MPRKRITDTAYWRNMPPTVDADFIPCPCCDRLHRMKQPGVVAIGRRLYHRQHRGSATLLVEYLTDPYLHGRDCDAEDVESDPHDDNTAARLEGGGVEAGEKERLALL